MPCVHSRSANRKVAKICPFSGAFASFSGCNFLPRVFNHRFPRVRKHASWYLIFLFPISCDLTRRVTHMAKAATKKAPTKAEIMNNIATSASRNLSQPLTKRDVAAVFDALAAEIKKNVGRKGPGQFAIPGLCKITVVHKPATKARKGINPFTGEEAMFKAKPARNVIKIRPLKSLKDMV